MTTAQPHAPLFVSLDNFLDAEELDALTALALESKPLFTQSTRHARRGAGWIVSEEQRKSRVLFRKDLQSYDVKFAGHVRKVLPEVLLKLGVEPFPVAKIEAQITASNDSDFLKAHRDSGSALPSREISYVYFFHREPKAFTGGELRIYYPAPGETGTARAGSFKTVVPRRNTIVLFRSVLVHEILPVSCPSRDFTDSRFTFNGWINSWWADSPPA